MRSAQQQQLCDFSSSILTHGNLGTNSIRTLWACLLSKWPILDRKGAVLCPIYDSQWTVRREGVELKASGGHASIQGKAFLGMGRLD